MRILLSATLFAVASIMTSADPADGFSTCRKADGYACLENVSAHSDYECSSGDECYTCTADPQALCIWGQARAAGYADDIMH